MLGFLRRHEVKISLKAGHKRTEVARLTGVSRSSVQRIAEPQKGEDLVWTKSDARLEDRSAIR